MEAEDSGEVEAVSSKAGDDSIEVEVVYALPHAQIVIPLRVSVGTTAGEAVVLAGVSARRAEIAPAQTELGIYGRRVSGDVRLAGGDRVEIYRPLPADPKQARRWRARKPG